VLGDGDGDGLGDARLGLGLGRRDGGDGLAAGVVVAARDGVAVTGPADPGPAVTAGGSADDGTGPAGEIRADGRGPGRPPEVLACVPCECTTGSSTTAGTGGCARSQAGTANSAAIASTAGANSAAASHGCRRYWAGTTRRADVTVCSLLLPGGAGLFAGIVTR